MNTTHNGSNRRHQLSISVLNDIDTFDGKQGHKLDDWLTDVENAAAIVEEDEVVVAKGKARGLAREGNTPLRFNETERSHHPSTHSAVPGHNKTLHCVH